MNIASRVRHRKRRNSGRARSVTGDKQRGRNTKLNRNTGARCGRGSGRGAARSQIEGEREAKERIVTVAGRE